MSRFTVYLGSIVVLFTAGSVSASLLASDNAGNAAYNGGTWAAGSNGGTGWGGGWSFVSNAPGSKGSFVASSTGNGDGDNNGNGDINSSGRAWGLYANGGGEIFAVRPFSGALSVGQKFSMDMDNGFIDNSFVIGMRLVNSLSTITNATREFEFRFVGGDSAYTTIAGNSQTSPLGYTDEGLHIEFTLTAANAYSLKVDRYAPDGSVQTWNTSGTTVSGQPILGVALRNNNAGMNAPFDGYYNSISITPEPTSLCLLGLASAMLVVPRRRA